MGLDVTAYSSVTRVQRDVNEELADDETYLCVVKEFAAAADGLESGIYRVAETYAFRAGSYSGYNHWRSALARMVGHKSARAVWDSPQPGPFVELINNADNEGTIGPRTSAKLARDFREQNELVPGFVARMPRDEREWFVDCYNNWARAFELAAGSGAVSLH